MDKDGLIPPGCGDPCTPATPGRSGETIDVMGLVRGMYYVRVFGAQDADTDYTLRVKVTAGELCREDFTEEVEPILDTCPLCHINPMPPEEAAAVLRAVPTG